MAIRESFLNILRPFTQEHWFRLLFWICIGTAAAYSIAKAILQPSAKASILVAVALQGEQTFEYLVMAAALLYFGMYFVLLNIPRIRDFKYESGVILGFLGNAVLANFGVLTRSVFGTRFFMVSKWLPAVAYIVGALIWFQTFMRTEPEIFKTAEPAVDLTPQQMKADLDRYQQFTERARAWLRRK
jgi:hypothetical protein